MGRAEAEGFLDEVLLCCPVLGLRGYESPNGFTVLKEARGRRDFTASSPDALMRTREQLIRQGVLAKQDNQVELLQDYEFKSPPQAAGLLLARSANGRLEWKDAARITRIVRRRRPQQTLICEDPPNASAIQPGPI